MKNWTALMEKLAGMEFPILEHNDPADSTYQWELVQIEKMLYKMIDFIEESKEEC